MTNMVHEIIRENPRDDFWIEPDNEFLFDDIVSMCKKAGYDMFIVPTKDKETEILTDFLVNGSDKGKQMLLENDIDPEAYKNLYKGMKKILFTKE